MKGKSKAGALALIAAVGVLAYYGIAHSKATVMGTHILNYGSFDFTTTLQDCPGFTFPDKVVPNKDLNKAPAVTGNGDPSDKCSTTYTSAPNDGSTVQTCQITMSGGSLSASGDCRTENAGAMVILGAS